jgi:hypothetical protein
VSHGRRIEGKNNSKKYLLESQRLARIFVDNRPEYGDDDDDDDDDVHYVNIIM